MEALRAKAKELLSTNAVQVVVGYAEGTIGRRRATFARTADEADRLVMDAACVQNLATYLAKAELKKLGRIALVALPQTQRAVLQLMSERQLRSDELTLLVVEGESVKVLEGAEALELHVALQQPDLKAEDREALERLAAMDQKTRWAYWQGELSRCVKCYACRSSCPMCYCGRCTMDCNRPQWVPVPAHATGNLQYHMVRAMHLAGRCVACGDCGRACPVGIPVHLLSFAGQQSTERHFGQRAGHSARSDYALGTFRPDDKETFIR